MAKARDIPGLHASMSFAEAAAATVAVRAEELFEHSEGVLDTSARCFPKDQFKPLLREVKALAGALGARRDPDVLLDRLAGLERVLPKADAPGIEAFAAPVREEQARGNETLAQALERAESTDLRGRLALLAASATAPEAQPEPVAAAVA